MPDSAEKTRLKTMTAWDQTPKLTDGEIDDLLVRFSKTDADGLDPDHEDWTPTYNLRAAAKEGWSIKMGRAAELQSTDLDGDRLSANQVFDHCQAMVKRYSLAASPTLTNVTTA
jgi:hypothetical protein